MQDLSALICPRGLIVVSGEKDEIFPIDGAKEGFETVKKIYADNKCPQNCKMIITPQNHWWCTVPVWQAINDETKRLGWR